MIEQIPYYRKVLNGEEALGTILLEISQANKVVKTLGLS